MLSGRRLDILNPSPLDIEIEDIAHGLARVSRWNGQTRGKHSFSVAQHCVLVERLVRANAPKLVTEELVKRMKPGSVLVDVAIDQGGCFETSRPTTHAAPTYVLHDVVHYCVANMPGAVPRTSTYALNNATLPFTLALADQGPRDALLADAHFLGGLNICGGMLTEQHVAEAQGLAYVPPAEALAKVYA